MARTLMIAYTSYAHDARVRRHAEALALRGDQVDVICLGGLPANGTKSVNVIGIPVARYRGSNRMRYVSSYSRFFAGAAVLAARRARAQRYNVVIVCTMPDAAVFCAIGPKLFGAKVILDVHDTMPELYRDKFPGAWHGAIGARLLMIEERASALLADRVIAVHQLHRQRLEAAGIPSRKIHVVVNSPDPAIFNRRALGDHPMDRPEDAFTVVCHGYIARRLGLDVALEAVARLRRRIPRLRLRIAGAGDYLPSLRALAHALGLEGRVEFVGRVPLDELPAVLRGAAVGLVPNRASSATHLMLPVKLLEYATLGIPVIAARLRTIEYYFGPEAVRFFAPDDARDLAAVIEELYANPQQRIRLARAARGVAERLTWQGQRGRLYEAVDSLLPTPATENPLEKATGTDGSNARTN